MYSTFDIPAAFEGNCARKRQSDQPENLMYNSYYQWVSIFLVFQAMLFYIPRVIWLMLEGGNNINIIVLNVLHVLLNDMKF